MSVHVYRISCVTNLHVGSGDINYSIIDNEVEKDPVTQYPTIPSFGLKGALREHFHLKEGIDEAYIFGAKLGDAESAKAHSSAYKFFAADFLARPLRVTDNTSKRNYVKVTSVQAITDFLRKMEFLGVKAFPAWEEVDFSETNFLVSADSDVTRIEGEAVGKSDANRELLTQLLGENYAIAHSLDEYDLPVVARCYLANGISQKLWYEEIVPHESEFYTVILTPDKEPCALDEEFRQNLIQLGGYASIGLGYTKFQKLQEA